MDSMWQNEEKGYVNGISKTGTILCDIFMPIVHIVYTNSINPLAI